MSLKHLLNLTGDRLRTLPILIFYLTDGCNSRCVTCDIWRNPRRDMPMPLVESVAGEMRALGVRWAVLSGGEAMQHPRWPEIAARFRAEGVRVILLTNGLFIRKQIDAVLANVDELVVSLDGGTAATYDAIRGVDAFDLVLEGIQLARQGGIPVTTRTTLQRANFRELPLIIDAARAVDVNHISFLTVDVSNPYAFGDRFSHDVDIPLADAVPAEHQPPADALTREDIAELAHILDDVETRFAGDFASGRIAESPDKLRRMIGYFSGVLGDGDFPTVRCNAPHTSAVIEVNGMLRPCYFLPTVGKVTPNVNLSQAINAEAAISLRRAYRTGQRAECGRCVCPLYKGPRSLLKL